MFSGQNEAWGKDGVEGGGGGLTLKIDRATWHFLKLTCDIEVIDMRKNITDMTSAFP